MYICVTGIVNECDVQNAGALETSGNGLLALSFLHLGSTLANV